VIADPPFDAGAVNVTEACPFPPVAVPTVGVPGTVAGVMEFDAADDVPVPTALVAVTLKVYAVPLVSPMTVMGEVVPVPVSPPGVEVTVYPVIADPPVDPGAVNVTEACAFPEVAVPTVGAPGTVAAVTEFEVEEDALVPSAFVAVTVKV
jgi:hypothetical protein